MLAGIACRPLKTASLRARIAVRGIPLAMTQKRVIDQITTIGPQPSTSRGYHTVLCWGLIVIETSGVYRGGRATIAHISRDRSQRKSAHWHCL